MDPEAVTRTLKAFRPSVFGSGTQDDDGWEGDQERQERIGAYAQRVAAGLPVFEEENGQDRRKKDEFVGGI